MRPAAILLLLAAGVYGCGGAAPVAPRVEAPVEKPVPEAVPSPPPVTTLTPEADPPASPVPSKPAADPKPAPADTVAAATPAVPEREVAVELGTAKRAELVVQARKDVVEAERLIAGHVPGSDTARNDKVRAVQGLVAQARTAMDMDPDAAATLAHKARLLAEEIAASR